jgi:hypothetical protein
MFYELESNIVADADRRTAPMVHQQLLGLQMLRVFIGKFKA